MTIIGNKYEILEMIGEGSFGKVFKGKNIRSKEDIAIKIQHKDISNVLRNEAKIYKYLKDISGIPQIRNFGTEQGFNYLILDLLECSLSDTKLNSIETVRYMIDAITIIENLHDVGIIHRDIKPDNFLIKNDNGKRILQIVDFGLSKFYLDANKKHIVERKDKKLIGTAKYVSLNIHNGIEPSRRDDIISICYTFFSMYGIVLPWTKMIDDTNLSDAQNLVMLYKKIKLIKEGPLNWLYDYPGEFLTILLYCRKLTYYEIPNYNYIKRTLQTLISVF